MGDWSMSMTLSSCSMPSMRSCSPGRTGTRLTRFDRLRKMISFTKVDLPDPDTPVTHTNAPVGTVTSRFFRLCSRRPADDELTLA